MRNHLKLPLTALVLAAAVGCVDPDPDPQPDGGPDVTDECLDPANVAKKDALAAAQPSIVGKKKNTLTVQATFLSEIGDHTQVCGPVELKFKDSNGNGTLDAYEDWRLPASQRAADLVGKLSAAEKVGLMVHPVITEGPTAASQAVSAGLKTLVQGSHVRFGVTLANTVNLTPRATWANNLQELAEETAFGIPFVLSSEPAHSEGQGRVKARGFSLWPHELGLGATADLAAIEKFGQIVSQEYRAIGIRMALSPSADLFTDPRWGQGTFTFGEDATKVGERVAAYVKGLQGQTLGATSVAAVAKHFPGAGATKDGLDTRIEKGRFLSYPGHNIDAHLSVFAKAMDVKVAGVMASYGIPETGAWTGVGGLDGSTLEQVGASFNAALMKTVLRDHYQFAGLAIAPAGVLEDKGVSPFGAPWGVELLTKTARAAKAVSAGIDQFIGLSDVAPLVAARDGGTISQERIDASANRALTLIFQLGLFENPYVDPAKAPAIANTDASYQAGLDAMNRSMVLAVNALKPTGWLNGAGDGTQTGDKGNAGNGSLRVLPAPPGEPYVSAGCRYYVAGDFNLDYVRSVSAGYGELTNDSSTINEVPVTTAAERMAMADYVFIRLSSPFTADADAGALNVPSPLLTWSGNANATELDDVTAAKNAIAAWNSGRSTGDAHYSRTQIVVGIDGGRLAVLDELAGVSAVYFAWGVSDKVWLDVAFGIVNGKGKLPVGVPLSTDAVSAQHEDVPFDGQHSTYVQGWGFETKSF